MYHRLILKFILIASAGGKYFKFKLKTLITVTTVHSCYIISALFYILIKSFLKKKILF